MDVTQLINQLDIHESRSCLITTFNRTIRRAELRYTSSDHMRSCRRFSELNHVSANEVTKDTVIASRMSKHRFTIVRPSDNA